jgi:hypothetical protein
LDKWGKNDFNQKGIHIKSQGPKIKEMGGKYMAKRRSTEGKSGKHGREGSEFSEAFSIKRRNNMIIAVVAVVIIAVILILVSFMLLSSEEPEKEPDVLSSTSTVNEGNPLDTAGYSFTLYNSQKEPDIFSTFVSELPPQWTVDIPSTISIEGKMSKTTDFTITPSPEFALNKTHTFKVTVTSGNTQRSYSLDYQLTIFHSDFGVKLFCYNNTHDADPGRSTSYALLIKNTGNGDDTYTLSYTESHLPNNWTVSFEFDSILVPALDYRVVICTIDTYENTSKGRYDISIIATSASGLSDQLWVNTSLVKNFTEEIMGEGDLLQVDYIGIFIDGMIFDTSVFDAANNTDLPKADDFQIRPSYSPLKIYVGPADNDPNPEDSYTGVITGFWEGVVGLKVGETQVVRFPSEKGYGDGRTRLFEIKVISKDS